FITGSSVDVAQLFAPHRSATQMLMPSLSMSTALAEPQVRPPGIFAQVSSVRYGLGRSFCGRMLVSCAPTTRAKTGAAIATRSISRAEARRCMVVQWIGWLWMNADLAAAHDRRVGTQRVGRRRRVICLENVGRDVEILLVFQRAVIVDRHRLADELVEVADAAVPPVIDELLADELLALMASATRRVVHLLASSRFGRGVWCVSQVRIARDHDLRGRIEAEWNRRAGLRSGAQSGLERWANICSGSRASDDGGDGAEDKQAGARLPHQNSYRAGGDEVAPILDGGTGGRQAGGAEPYSL